MARVGAIRRAGGGVTNDPRALLAHPMVVRLARALAGRPGAHADADVSVRRAAVAVVLAPGDAGEPELLFIKRAEYAGDPWSGQIAFPGGRQEPSDLTLEHTAIRETWEETGLDLRGAMAIGTLDEIHPRTPVLPPIVVRPYVFLAPAPVELALSAEVAAAFWAPLPVLVRPEAAFEATVEVRHEERRVPAIRHAEYTIWGMTERILRELFARVAHDGP